MELRIQGLTHQYKKGVKALNEIDLTINHGLIGLLGPNGAGKSTLMSILSTLLKPTEGSVFLNDKDIVKNPNVIRAALGYLPQHFGVYDQLSGKEFLKYMAAIKGIGQSAAKSRIDDLLSMLNLHHARNQKLKGYSGGMRQRIGIAQALLNDPDILIFDEPTVGLDPEERIRFRRLLADISGDKIVILSTHIVSDVASIASEIIIINEGQLITQNTPDGLIATLENCVWQVVVSAEEAAELELSHTVSNTTRRAGGFELRVISDSSPSNGAKPVAPTLEDCYLHFTRQKSV